MTEVKKKDGMTFEKVKPELLLSTLRTTGKLKDYYGTVRTFSDVLEYGAGIKTFIHSLPIVRSVMFITSVNATRLWPPVTVQVPFASVLHSFGNSLREENVGLNSLTVTRKWEEMTPDEKARYAGAIFGLTLFGTSTAVAMITYPVGMRRVIREMGRYAWVAVFGPLIAILVINDPIHAFKS